MNENTISANDWNNLVLKGIIKFDKNGKPKLAKGIAEYTEYLKRQQIVADQLFAKEEYDYNTDKTFRYVNIDLPGEPMPKQSTRFAPDSYYTDGVHICPYTGATLQHKRGDVRTSLQNGLVRCFVRAYTDSALETRKKEYQTLIKAQLPTDFKLFEEEVYILGIDFVFPILKSMPQKITKAIEDGAVVYKNKKPDCDNICKLLLDAMNGLVYVDDGSIVSMSGIRKIFGIEPKVVIKLKGC